MDAEFTSEAPAGPDDGAEDEAAEQRSPADDHDGSDDGGHAANGKADIDNAEESDDDEGEDLGMLIAQLLWSRGLSARSDVVVATCTTLAFINSVFCCMYALEPTAEELAEFAPPPESTEDGGVEDADGDDIEEIDEATLRQAQAQLAADDGGCKRVRCAVLARAACSWSRVCACR